MGAGVSPSGLAGALATPPNLAVKGCAVDRFSWGMEDGAVPPEWDLRSCGWQLCSADDAGTDRLGPPPVLLDARRLTADQWDRLPAPWEGSRLVVVGVACSVLRARLLARGCAEVLGCGIDAAELALRVRRVQAARIALPRALHVGPLLLDLMHRDARRGARWLGLHPREFSLLWRLAEEPGMPVTRRTLLQDVWRIHHEPDTNSVEVHVSRLRGKLALAGCGNLLRTATTGGYRLEPGAALTQGEPPGPDNLVVG